MNAKDIIALAQASLLIRLQRSRRQTNLHPHPLPNLQQNPHRHSRHLLSMPIC